MGHCVIEALIADIGSIQNELEEVIITHSGHTLTDAAHQQYGNIAESIREVAVKLKGITTTSRLEYKYAKQVLDTIIHRFTKHSPVILAIT